MLGKVFKLCICTIKTLFDITVPDMFVISKLIIYQVSYI
jgi:hypothetical protein